MWIKILCIEYILWGIPTIESTIDVANMVKTVTVKDVPIKKWCASKHTGLLNSCLGKLCLHPYLVVPLISARVTLISTRVSAHCQAILLRLDEPQWTNAFKTHVDSLLYCGVSEKRCFNQDSVHMGRRKTFFFSFLAILGIKGSKCLIENLESVSPDCLEKLAVQNAIFVQTLIKQIRSLEGIIFRTVIHTYLFT